jgi:hypothetical protein
VIVRADLTLGLLAAQVVHAAGESAVLRAPPEGTHAVVLAAMDEAELLRVRDDLLGASVPHVAVVEDEAPFTGALMALGVAPLEPGVQRYLRRLPTLCEKVKYEAWRRKTAKTQPLVVKGFTPGKPGDPRTETEAGGPTSAGSSAAEHRTL